MKQYEITYLTKEDPKNPASEGPVKEIIESVSGKVLSGSAMGQKQLVYKIKKQTEAYFSNLIFEIDEEKLNDLNRKLNLKEEVLRYLVVVFKKAKIEESQTQKIAKKTETKEPEIKAEKPSAKVETETITEIKDKTETKEPKLPRKTAVKKAKTVAKEDITEEERLKTLDEKLNELLKE